MSKTRGVKGATTVENNTEGAIKAATIELLNEMIIKNSFSTEDISHVIFTLTQDLNAAFPAKFARVDFDWDAIPMVCSHEIPVPNSLERCIRVIIVINTELEQNEIKHVYLKNAQKLRPDLNN